MKHIIGKDYTKNKCENCQQCIELGKEVGLCMSNADADKKNCKK